MTLNVIDVSRYQAGLDLNVPKQAGCNAVIVGATFGTAGINPAAFAQLDGTKAAGMLRGVYHIRARQNTTAVEEANYFLNHVRGYLDGSTLPVLDWEECDTSDESWALAWLNEVFRQTGIRAWFYVNLADLLKYKYPRIAAAGYAVWLASYPYNTIDGFQGVNWTPQPIPAGHTLVAWQYVGTGGSLAGYQGLDLSVAYIDAKGWAAYARPQITPDASTVTPIKTPQSGRSKPSRKPSSHS
jgi:GH25 family lysozyme M1 (1,4-beta-N-acetylmuramidase)